MVKLSVLTTFLNFIVKVVPILEKIFAKITDQKLRGPWCACWQNNVGDRDYQIGTVNMLQISKAVSGTFYSGDGAWPFRAEFNDGQLTGTYKISNEPAGFFRLRFADNGLNKNRLTGSWTGLIRDTETGGVVERGDLKIFMGRKDAVCEACHIKKFASDEGHCTR